MKHIKFMFRFIKPHLWRYVIGIAVLAVVDYASVIIPKITGEVTDGLATHTMDMNGVVYCVKEILLLGLAMVIGRFMWRIFLILTARKVEFDIRDQLFKHLELQDVEYYNEHKTGGLMSHFTQDLNAIRQALGPAIICTFDATVMAIMVIVQMIRSVSFRLTGIIIIPMLVIMFGEIYFGTFVHKVYRGIQKAFEELSDYVQESFSGARVIKSFVQEENQAKAFEKQNDKTRKKNLFFARMIAIEIPALDFIIGLSSLITLLIGGKMAIRGDITLGNFVAFTQYINMLVWPMIAAGDSINMFSRGTASMGRLEEIFDTESDITVSTPKLKEGEEIPVFNGDITMKNLTFTHKDGNEATIKDFNLEIKKGTTLAIIGRTGSGKSTLMNLLLHLYQMDEGQIFIDEQDIRQIPLKVLRKNIAYVPQDNILFSDTLANNISFGVGEATMEEIRKAAKDACIDDNIMEFTDQYETVVGERGVTLSGGQKQRSAIARAFLKDAPILILDDSLSAVDTDTEEQILKNIKELREGKTTIIIAHRITTIQNADDIVVIEEGKKAEEGTHAELMDNEGIYYSMFMKQQLEAERLFNEGGEALC